MRADRSGGAGRRSDDDDLHQWARAECDTSRVAVTPAYSVRGRTYRRSTVAATAPVENAVDSNRRGTRAATVVSLFSGAGGLDLGLEQAGWQILAQIEMDDDCIATLNARARETANPPLVIPKRIEDVPPAELRKRLGIEPGELELLAGGPPCQPFTTHGLRQSLADRRAMSAFPAYLEYVRELDPEALLIENVDGLLSAALRHRPLKLRGRDAPPLRADEMKGSFLRWLVIELVQLGYAVAWGVSEAADFGVPQFRQRAILIGVKGSQPCFLPLPTHGPDGHRPYKTIADALGEITELGPVQPLSARKRAVYELIPAGGNWRNLPQKLQRKTMGAAYHATGGKSGWWRRLAWDAPAPTILGMPDHSSTALVHPDEVRCISVAESAALQSFPSGTEFAGSGRAQYQQIGNAVPPALAEALGRQIRRFLDGHRDPEPPRPAWRKTSANRRIGTHGWAWDEGRRFRYHLHVRIRPDHVWARMADGVLATP
jgi:DNA (cytosine-5)-methyltransferase 1